MFKQLIMAALILAGLALEDSAPTNIDSPLVPHAAPAPKGNDAAPKWTVQVLFTGVEGVTVASDENRSCQIPGRLDFEQSHIHRLKLSGIPRHDKLELHPSLEIAPLTPRTEAYVAGRAVKVPIIDKDYAHVAAGNYLTKVIYLLDAQSLEKKGDILNVMSSTDLPADHDPILEADRMGSILAILRVSPPPK